LQPDCALAAEVLASPNHGERRSYLRADSIILHYTGMATADAAIALLRDPASEVSSHYVVDEAGRVVQLVPEARRAWHAGASCWRNQRDMNSASIGVEICNPGHEGGLPPFPERQIEAVVLLCRDIMARCAIRPERVLAHSDIAPARKRDPGERFPWDALAREGVGHWVDPDPPDGAALVLRGQEGPSVRSLQSLLALYGYDVDPSGVYDVRTEVAVAAFQRHFRPGEIDGVADRSTVATLRRLLAALPASADC
jgi:N-acetylmuramoyl-L-alanine amidase